MKHWETLKKELLKDSEVKKEYMKQIQPNKKKFSFGWKAKALGILLVFILLLGLGNAGLKAINSWFERHELVFNRVVNLEFKKPIEIQEREQEGKEFIKIIETIPAPQDLETDFDLYVYEVFGIEHYRMALAVSRCEGYNHPEDGWNGNDNGSIDVGKFRINSVNFKIPGCSLKEVVDEKKNVDCAYTIWDRADGEAGNKQGNFSAWVGYTNGCALTKYE